MRAASWLLACLIPISWASSTSQKQASSRHKDTDEVFLEASSQLEERGLPSQDLAGTSEEEGAKSIASLLEKAPEILACATEDYKAAEDFLWKLALQINYFTKKSKSIHMSGVRAYAYNVLDKFCKSRGSEDSSLCRDIVWSRLSTFIDEASRVGDVKNKDASYVSDTFEVQRSDLGSSLSRSVRDLLREDIASDENSSNATKGLDLWTEVNSNLIAQGKPKTSFRCKKTDTASIDTDWRILFPNYKFRTGLLFRDPKLNPDWLAKQFKTFKDQGISQDALIDGLVGYQNIIGEQVAIRDLELPEPHVSKTSGEWVEAVKVANPDKMFVVDGSLDSSQPRVFALNLGTGKIELQLKTGHGKGRGKYQNSPETEKYVSNTTNSNLTPPPGDFMLMEHFYSRVTAQSILVAGLNDSNSNTVNRGVWWHSYKQSAEKNDPNAVPYVSRDLGVACGNSQGCRPFKTEDLNMIYNFVGFDWDEKSGIYSSKKGGESNSGIYVRVYNPDAIDVSVSRSP